MSPYRLECFLPLQNLAIFLDTSVAVVPQNFMAKQNGLYLCYTDRANLHENRPEETTAYNTLKIIDIM